MDEDGYFGEEIAARYDDGDSVMYAPETIAGTADRLAELAGPGGRALEFAIGTGRIGLPLAERGVEVHGIELSRAMVKRLRAKPGGTDLPVTIGDMSATRVPGQFQLVYLVFNTIGNLTTQEGQVACFANAAAHLAPGGCFVIEVGVPDLRRLPPGQTTVPVEIREGYWWFVTYDVVTQLMMSTHVEVGDGRGRYNPVPLRYVWPSELDLMARLAGLRLRDRWQDWDRTPFTADSTRHVSVWEKPA